MAPGDRPVVSAALWGQRMVEMLPPLTWRPRGLRARRGLSKGGSAPGRSSGSQALRPGVYVLRLSASRGDVGNAGSGGAHVVPSLRWPHNQLPRSTPVTLRRRSAEASVGQLSEAGSRTPLFGMRLAKFGDGTSTRFLT